MYGTVQRQIHCDDNLHVVDLINAAGLDETFGTYVDDECFGIHDYDDDGTNHDTDGDTDYNAENDTNDDTDDGGRGDLYTIKVLGQEEDLLLGQEEHLRIGQEEDFLLGQENDLLGQEEDLPGIPQASPGMKNRFLSMKIESRL